VSGFLTHYRRLIQWLPDPRGFWRPANTGEAVISGAEVRYGGRMPLGLSPWTAEAELSAEALFALDKNEGPTFDKQLPYRPEYRVSASVGVTHLLGHRVSVDARRVGARPANRQNTVWLDPYTVVDVAAGLVVPNTPVTLGARVNNLLDARFVETRFYPNPGVELVLTAEVSW
jgi:outer membrane receptor protein involved in Fe transport